MINVILTGLFQFFSCICKEPEIVELRHAMAKKIQTAFRKYLRRKALKAISTYYDIQGIQGINKKRKSISRRHRRTITTEERSSEEETIITV